MASIQDLPDDVLLAVLCLLPINELIWNCQLVCSRWRDILHSPFLWKRKYQEEDADLKMPKTFYIFCHLEKNLIKNPCGEEGLHFWDTATPSNGQWKVKDVFEKDSAKLQAWDFLQRNIYIKDEWIPYQEVEKCFAAYNGLCTKSQLITLKDEGYWDQLMDDGRPTIVVKDWFFSSFNSHYKLCVKLLSEDFQVIREYDSGDKYKYDSEYNDEWRQASHAFHNVPPGIRHIFFQHQGQHFNWQQSSCGTKLMKCLKMAKERGKSQRMRITKTSVTIGPFSLDKTMHHRHGRDIRHCHFGQCPCRGNYVHWSLAPKCKLGAYH
ncbi:F-box only protein 44-like [Pseudonaja textilis]|uniref:F-box only protein 44-like n=1 Tax=Pseudonaja textilis TaxID=8673 RepID=UPI000EA9F611|nr:F-box only protein 44-like [Pseudonaja textilis]